MKKFATALLLSTLVILILWLIGAPLMIVMFSLGADYGRGELQVGPAIGLLFVGTMISVAMLLLANKLQERSQRSDDER